jgi:amino acid adenylation domain-containing protein
MTESALSRRIERWNETDHAYPAVCLHDLLAEQIAATPDAVAVTDAGTALTYAELGARIDRLAGHLRTLGVGPETIVGLCTERSLEMIVGIGAILAAGGAYLPLEPTFPRERNEYMLGDARPPVVLAQAKFRELLPAAGFHLHCIDTDDDRIAEPVAGARGPAPAPGNLAYVFYTSGSTGKPKGVMIEHRAIVNRMQWIREAIPLTPADVVLQKTPFTFDISVCEIFWPLISGARLVMARPGGHTDPAYLADAIARHGITVIKFVPTVLQLVLAEHGLADRASTLRLVISGGEALPRPLMQRFFATLPNAELINLYGPTEAAVEVAIWRCDPDADTVLIGRPIANTQLHVLDPQMQPVPVGEIGELHIGGVQVARGYLNKQELTAERFVPDPFRDDGRLYKTGDLARFCDDGQIECLGRIDHQVKILGVRIELGEIESALESHPRIRRAAVVAREAPSGDKQLVAYVVTADGQPVPVAEVRSHLAQSLTEQMIPSVFITLEAMPLTASGKTDRNALPDPQRKRPELDGGYVAPRTALERKLAELWARFLDLDRIGVRDRFFELGGNSLQAARIVADLRTELGENLHIVSMFEAPSVAEYAAFLERHYADALARLGLAAGPRTAQRGDQRVDATAIERMRALVPSVPLAKAGRQRNAPALFVLAPPRSGTTLLRVMLAGHPGLFAAAELQLLGFESLPQRAAAYSGKYGLWLEGAVRAIMEIEGCDGDAARRIMAEHEARGSSTGEFYRVLQERIAPRMLVDKSPQYALDPGALQRAERDFDGALYIHLSRHPYAMIKSFEKYRMDQVLYLHEQPFTARTLAELVWLVSHRNILEFLDDVPARRHVHVRYEDLVRDPEAAMRLVCERLGLEMHEAMLKPYEAVERKMVDGVHDVSMPMGDTNFLRHGAIKPGLADAWRGVLADDFLGEPTWQTAAQLGYQRGGGPPAEERSARRDRHLADSRRRRAVRRSGGRNGD